MNAKKENKKFVYVGMFLLIIGLSASASEAKPEENTLGKQRCREMIQNASEADPRLFTAVLNCELQREDEAFAAAEDLAVTDALVAAEEVAGGTTRSTFAGSPPVSPTLPPSIATPGPTPDSIVPPPTFERIAPPPPTFERITPQPPPPTFERIAPQPPTFERIVPPPTFERITPVPDYRPEIIVQPPTFERIAPQPRPDIITPQPTPDKITQPDHVPVVIVTE